jgi:hypothetical protein
MFDNKNWRTCCELFWTRYMRGSQLRLAIQSLHILFLAKSCKIHSSGTKARERCGPADWYLWASVDQLQLQKCGCDLQPSVQWKGAVWLAYNELPCSWGWHSTVSLLCRACSGCRSEEVTVQLDYKNRANKVCRQSMLAAVRAWAPLLLPFAA